MRRIALNGRFTGNPQPTGTQKAAFHLFDQIHRRNRDFEFVVFADSRFPGVAEWKSLPHTTFVETPLQDWSRPYAQFWEQIILPRLCHDHGCSLAHHPITTSPIWRNGCKSVVTLHDLNFHLHPEWYSTAYRLAYAICATPGLRNADRVVTISNYVRNQARDFLGIPEDKLRMVHNGSTPLTPDQPPRKPEAPYILCVGALPVHKNLNRVIGAYQLLRSEFTNLELHLVGRPHPQMGRTDSELSKLLTSPGVKSLGYLSDTELANAYAGAAVFCYPSLEEGFGLPLLEAMSVGTPVVTSNVSCLPEIAGPSAIQVNPYSVAAIADGLRTALRLSPLERESRAKQGLEWSSRFSWAATADTYLQIYAELL